MRQILGLIFQYLSKRKTRNTVIRIAERPSSRTSKARPGSRQRRFTGLELNELKVVPRRGLMGQKGRSRAWISSD
jgi:hypothetical protein